VPAGKEHPSQEVRSGFVALVGRPNSGKSTLVNALVGSKVAITSDTPQTTRHRLRAVVDRDDSQMVLVDTPGLHKPHDALGEELNRSALKALEDVDVVAMLLDATKPVGRGDEWVAEHVARTRAKRLLVVTKADIASAEQVNAQVDAARRLVDFDDVVVLSALEGFNLEGFMAAAERYLPMGPRWFPRDMPTDQPIEVLVAEFVREKVLRATFDEVPHAVGVVVEEMEAAPRSDLTRIWAVIYVERDSQKGIIIGRGGEMIKRVGSEARVDLERLLGGRVHLELTVKVKKDWRRDASQIRRFGYGEGL
jgi:GTP-binding protein Era